MRGQYNNQFPFVFATSWHPSVSASIVPMENRLREVSGASPSLLSTHSVNYAADHLCWEMLWNGELSK